ncbi:hypothetical protein LXL04_007682 [Taraxacum kok-saghyz]
MLVLFSDVGCAGRNRVSNRPAELLKLHNYIYISINMFCMRLIIYYVAGIINRGLTYVHVHVVTKIEGRTSGDTAATTSSQLRRSDRGESGRAGLCDLGGLDSGCVVASLPYMNVTPIDCFPFTKPSLPPATAPSRASVAKPDMQNAIIVTKVAQLYRDSVCGSKTYTPEITPHRHRLPTCSPIGSNSSLVRSGSERFSAPAHSSFILAPSFTSSAGAPVLRRPPGAAPSPTRSFWRRPPLLEASRVHSQATAGFSEEILVVFCSPATTEGGPTAPILLSEHLSSRHLESWFESYDLFSTAVQKLYISLFVVNITKFWPKRDNRAGCPGFDKNAHRYRKNHKMPSLSSDVGCADRSLTHVHICVVTEIEGSTPGDTTATTSSQLRRSDRGGFPYNILITSHYFASVALSVCVCVCVCKLPSLADSAGRVYVTLADSARPGESDNAGLYDLSGQDSGQDPERHTRIPDLRLTATILSVINQPKDQFKGSTNIGRQPLIVVRYSSPRRIPGISEKLLSIKQHSEDPG